MICKKLLFALAVRAFCTKGGVRMKALQKAGKFLSDNTSAVVIAIAVITFFVPASMGWVNYHIFTDWQETNLQASL